MAEKRTWRLDRKLTATMVEDFICDPILGAKVLLNLQVPPHEELRILWMWTHYYTNDDSGFSTGKSFNHAVISALRSILFPGRVSGVLSKTYAQGKLIFTNFDRWYETCPIFRWCIKHKGGKPQLIHGSDAHVATFRGGSTIRVLPPNFMQDAERLRSERWNDGYFDEWTTFGNYEAFNKTIIGRVTRENYFPDCPIRQNHIHLSSTPNFTHHPSYAMVRRIQRLISSGNLDHGRFTCNYRHIPDTKEWKWLINRKVIFTMQTSLPPGVVKSEIDGIWQRDSLSFYSSKKLMEVRYESKVIQKRMHESDIYIAGFDVARGSQRTSEGDDFALSVYRISGEHSVPHHCLTVRYNNITAEQMAAVVQKYHLQLGFRIVVYDPGGGGLFVRDELRKDQVTIGNIKTTVTPIVELGDTSGVMGDVILIPFRRAHPYVKQMWGTMQSDSVIVNHMHRSMKAAIETRNIILAGEWNGWEQEGTAWDVDAKREWLNRNVGMSDSARLLAEMDLAVSQIVLVDVARDGNGEAKLDTFGMYRFKSKHKKDSAYSLIYAYVGYLLWAFLNGVGMSMSGADGSDSVVSVNEI